MLSVKECRPLDLLAESFTRIRKTGGQTARHREEERERESETENETRERERGRETERERDSETDGETKRDRVRQRQKRQEGGASSSRFHGPEEPKQGVLSVRGEWFLQACA